LSANELELDLAPLFGSSAPAHSMATNMTVRDFLDRAGANWRRVLDPNAQLYDIAVVENIEYFVNLATLMQTNPRKVLARLELFIIQTLEHMQRLSCLDKTFALSPMTTCNLFSVMSLGRTDDSPDPSLDEMADDVLKIVKQMYSDTEYAKIRIQRCSSIFHSDNIGQILQTKESQREELNLATETHIGWMVDTLKFLSTYYNPTYLYYSYPRVLDSTDSYLDTPLRWWAQTNAWYDWFRDLVVIPIGFCIFPLHRKGFTLEQKIQMAFILAHEFVHSYQEKDQAPKLCCKQYLSAEKCSTDRRFELHSDVVGLQIAVRYYLNKTPVIDRQRLTNMLVHFGQMFCSLTPTSDPDGVHGSPMERVDISWKELSLESHNNCKPAPKCQI